MLRTAMFSLMVLGMFGVQTGITAGTSTLMENITSLKDEPLGLVAIIVASVLMALIFGHFFCQLGYSMTNETHPIVIRGKQWIKKTEFEIVAHPSHKKHPSSNENESTSDTLPEISKKFGQIKANATGLRDRAEDRVKCLTKFPYDIEKENCVQLKAKLIQFNKAHLAHQKDQSEKTDEVKRGQI